MKTFILFLLLLLYTAAKAQPQNNELERLHLSLKNAANDTVRMDFLVSLGFYYYSKNGDSAHFYLDQGRSLAHQLNLRIDEANLLSSKGYLLTWNNYPKALELFLQALRIVEDPASEKNTWNIPAGQTPHGLRLSALGGIYFNMAQLYGNTGNTEKQIFNLTQAGNIATSVGDSGLNLLANLNLGDVYFDKLKKLDSALHFEQKALSFFSKSIPGSDNDIGWILNTTGKIYQEKGDFTAARDALHNGLKHMQDAGSLSGIGGICLSLSSFYNAINKTDSSLLYANNALTTYNVFRDPGGVANAWSAISSAYEKQKRTDSAFVYSKLATALRDSLNNAERKNLLAYQNANFGEQMRIKNLEDEKIKTQTKIKTYALLAGILVFMVIAFLLYRNSRHRQKANELLQKQKVEIAEQKESVEQTLVELKSAQAQLIQAEKMASLGQLTAGIAHEIQNPLNFVNNFAEVSEDLITELKADLATGNLQSATEIANDIQNNLVKVSYHGKRAEGIVKNMLQHSRKSEGELQATDINALSDEYLKMAYHGLRAKDKDFNVTLKTDFDSTLDKQKIIPQDIGRVLLNLFTNAFYTVNEKSKRGKENYVPCVIVSTKKEGDKVLINVKDNGNGIAQPVIDKIFQPFFTTKPTGSGTGLGLSLAYDIVKAHGGEIKVNSVVGEGSEFIVVIPEGAAV